MNKDTIVSICMITYNHEAFIAEAIEGVVMQKTNFPFLLVIGEDCSTDTTRAICLQYKEKYPDIIQLHLPINNCGAQPNFLNTYSLCQGKYIAICEGDDYWTDPYKLQKQVDLMEANPSFSMCAHAANVLMCGQLDENAIDKTVLTLQDIISENWGIMTASILFRKEEFEIPDWYSSIKNGDYGLQLLLALKGNIGYLSDNMSVYRHHLGGVSTTLKPLNQTAWIIYLLYLFNKHTKQAYKQAIKKRIAKIYTTQIFYAKGYSLRKAAAVLTVFKLLSPMFPFLIRYLRK